MANVAMAPVKGTPAIAPKLMPVSDNGAGLTIREAVPVLGPNPVPTPPGVSLYTAEIE